MRTRRLKASEELAENQLARHGASQEASEGGQTARELADELGWDDVASQLDSWGVAAFAADAGGEVAHFDVDWRTPSALVVGSEAHGLSGAVRADSRVNLCRIPLGVPVGAASDAQRVESAVESLNAAVAGSIILFEAQRQRLQRVAPE